MRGAGWGFRGEPMGHADGVTNFMCYCYWPPPSLGSPPASSLAQVVLNDVAMSRVLSHPNLLSSISHEVLDCPEAPDQVEVRTYYPLKDMDALDYLHKHGALKQEVGWPWL